ncbi:MAG: hypothetical protein J0I47_06340 [Sphingomonas sp.]|uniref:hypothetical protein n=1 Tax=Sphingomonas sp. TaxID=28214 RepID=UPI001ACC7FEC|nr:hypothetical protein [Sphingomonas sp.]MBN8807839.1 hypothetical protein [Sphingomonas sp.]
MKVSLILLPACVAISAAVAAQTQPPAPAAAPRADPNSKLVNFPTAPWVTYGPDQVSKYDDKGGPQGYPMTRVTVSAAGKNAWDAGGNAPLSKALAAGDVVFVAVYLRAPQLKDGETATLPFIGVNGATPPYETIAAGSATITNQWKQYYAVGKAPRAFPAGGAQAAIHLAGEKHVIDLGPIRVFDFGPNADMTRLPHN